MPALATKLMPMVRRTVVDDTRLAGYYDAEFDFPAELPPPTENSTATTPAFTPRRSPARE
jgi:uncharacterized protein (TIGR03435 family)